MYVWVEGHCSAQFGWSHVLSGNIFASLITGKAVPHTWTAKMTYVLAPCSSLTVGGMLQWAISNAITRDRN